MILSQQSIRTVGDTHGDDAHGADHHHGNIHVREDCHDSSSYGGKKKSYLLAAHIYFVLLYYCTVVHTDGKSKRSQDVDDLNAQIKVVEVLLKDSWKR